MDALLNTNPNGQHPTSAIQFLITDFQSKNNFFNNDKICSAYTCIHPAGCSRRESRNTGSSPFSFTISVLGSFTCITQHTGPTAIMVKCLAQGHKRRDRPGRDSNSHSGNARTWVQCTRPLGHNTPWVFGSRHGKGPSDGERAVIKNHASTAVKAGRAIIKNAKDLYDYTHANLEKKPTVHVYMSLWRVYAFSENCFLYMYQSRT